MSVLEAFRRRRRARVILNTTTGKSFRAVLWSRGRYWQLRDAELLDGSTGEPRPVDGVVVLERDKVDFYQVLNG